MLSSMKFTFRKGVFVLLCVVWLTQLTVEKSFGQLIHYTDINSDSGYVVGNVISTSGGWSTNGTGTSTVSAESSSPITSTVTGYNGGGGNYLQTAIGTTKAYIKPSGGSISTSQPAVIYYSFLINVSSANTSGAFPISLITGSTGTSYFAKVHLKDNGSGTGFYIGCSKSGTSTTGTYKASPTSFSYNTTYLVLVKYSYVSGTTNDSLCVWVNPTISTEPSTTTAEVSDVVSATDGGTNATLSFVLRLSNTDATFKLDGIRFARGTTSASAWSSLGAYTAPAAPSFTTQPTSVSTVCSGSNITLSTAASGSPTYQWQRSTTGSGGTFTNITGASMDAGVTYSGITTGTLTLTGATSTVNGYAYRVVATNGTGSTNSNTATVNINPVPTAFSVSGGGAYCSGGSGIAVGLSGSQTGVNYQLYNGASTVGSPVSGTGSALSFGLQTTAGTYSVVATNTTTTCTNAMTGSAVVSVNPLPIAYSVIGGGAYCSGGSGVAVGLANSQSGVNYQLYNGVSTVGSPVSGTGSAISFGLQTTAGTYSVVATNATTSCTQNMTGTTAISIDTPPASPASITGTFSLCGGYTTTLSNTTPGGSWSSSNNSIATINSSGVVSTITAGTTTISYTITSGTCSTSATQVFTVTAAPDAGSITGASSVCQANTITLSNTAMGGTWTSSATGIATINASGVVLGSTAGTTTISYSVTSEGCTSVSTKTITVTTPPSSGTISGSTTVCENASTLLSSTVGSGTWSSANMSIATINPTSGLMTGVSAGTTTISYTVTTGCSATSIYTVTVNPAPSAGTISGTSTVCVGANTTLSNGVVGGTWSSSNSSIATINSGSGVVGGVSDGSATTTYTVTSGGCSSFSTYAITVNPLPTVAATSGPSSVCTGSSITLSNATTSGTWSSSNNTLATVNSSGVVFGVSSGSPIISYQISNSCGTATATYSVTVNTVPATPSSITGTTSLCVGATTTLSSATPSGTWSSSNNTLATVNASGVVFGVSAGSPNITYTITNACGSSFTTTALTVNTVPSVPAITGTTTLNIGGTSTLANVTGGGTWTSSNTSVATIGSSSGVVFGVSGGTTTISYTVTNSCGNTTVTTAVSVSNPFTNGNLVVLQPQSNASTATSIRLIEYNTSGSLINSYNVPNTGSNRLVITGSATAEGFLTLNAERDNLVLVGYDTLTGVTASSSSVIRKAIATLSANYVYNRPYSTNSVFSANAIRSGALFGSNYYAVGGTSGVVYMNTPTTIFNGVTGNRAISILNGNLYFSTGAGATGIYEFSGIPTSTSTATSRLVAANANQFAISPDGNTVYIACNTAGAGIIKGTRTGGSGNFTLASGYSSGVVLDSACMGLAVDFSTTNPTIYATFQNGMKLIKFTDAGAFVSGASVTVLATSSATLPFRGLSFAPSQYASISGTTTICAGNTTSITINANPYSTVNYTLNGSPASIVIGANGLGYITSPSTAGTYTYSLTNVTTTIGTKTVSGSATVTINSIPTVNAISGITNLCVGSNTTLSSTTPSGTWSSSNLSVATINSTGVVSAVSNGSAIITYSVSSLGCTGTDTAIVNIYNAPATGTITGSLNGCIGYTSILSNATSGGTWSSSNTTVATIDPTSGIVYSLTGGTTNITYTTTNPGCSAFTSQVFTVNAAPSAGTISGTATLCPSTTTTLSSTVPAGVWSSGNTGIATVNTSTGVVYGVSGGTATISYGVTSGSCTGYSTYTVSVSPAPDAGTITGTSLGICIGSNVTLSNSVIGGTWSSSNISVATINSSTGVAYGLSNGTTTITYLVTGTSCTNFTTSVLSVSPTPFVAAISGATAVCEGGVTTLSNATAGGTWSSSNPSAATIASSGVVFGVSSGTTTISYTYYSGCTAYATSVITTNPIPSAGTITGSSTVTIGFTTTLSNATSGGVWSSSDTTIVSVDPTTGVVTGISSGSATITYAVTTSGCTGYATKSISTALSPIFISTVSPNSGYPNTSYGSASTITISGGGFNAISSRNFVWIGGVRAAVLGGTTTSLSVIMPSGSNYGPVMVIDSASKRMAIQGMAEGYSQPAFLPGFDNSKFISTSLNFKTKVDISTGSGSTPNIAAIGDLNNDGKPDIVTCNVGTTSISIYRNVSTPSSLTSSSFILDTTLSTGSFPVNVKLADMNGDGKLDILNTSQGTARLYITRNATSTTSGKIIVAAPFFVTTASATYGTQPQVLTVADFDQDGRPDVAMACLYSGYDCISVIRNRSTTTSFAASTFATPVTFQCQVNSKPLGIVSGDYDGDGKPDIAVTCTATNKVAVFRNTAIMDTISSSSFASRVEYSVGTQPIDIISADIDGDGKSDLITSNNGGNNVSVLRNTGSSGSLGFATNVNFTTASNPTGLAIGDMNGDTKPDVIVTNAGSGSISVFRNTATSGTITSSSFGTRVDLTVGTLPYGVNVADLDSNGFVDIVSANYGSNTISIIKNAPIPYVASISGSLNVCASGGTTTLSDSSSGGTWSLASSTTATIDPVTGVVTGLAVGSTTVTYSVTIEGETNYATATLVTRALPTVAAITGPSSVCPGSTITLANTTPSGIWGITNDNASINSSGVVNGLLVGNDTATYTVTNIYGCITTVTYPINIPLPPNAGVISGTTTFCEGATSLFSTSGDLGGIWSSSNTSAATIDASSGLATGTGGGTAMITYTYTNACGTAFDTINVNVNPLPTAPAAISGLSEVCVGSNITLSNSISGGAWSSSNTSIATIHAVSGVLGGVSASTVTISYTTTNACGSRFDTAVITVNDIPSTPASISGITTICTNNTTTLSSATVGGVWSSSNVAIATVSATGIAEGLTAGSAIITYAVSNICGSNSDTILLNVVSQPSASITGVSVPCYGYAGTINITGTSGATIGYRIDGGSVSTAPLTGGSYALSTGIMSISHNYTLFNVASDYCTVLIDSTIVVTPQNMQWVGGASGSESDWNVAANWSCGTAPSVTDNIIIPSGTIYSPEILTGATGNAQNITIASAAGIVLNTSSILNIKGNINNDGAITGNGIAILNGSALQYINGIGSIDKLELNNSNGATIQTASKLTVKRVLTITNGTLNTGDSLVLAADATNTARVAPITSGGINGQVLVQQYIPGGRRAYRFISHPFNSPISLTQLSDDIDITGTGGATNGFTTTGSNASSAFWYNPLYGNSASSYDPGWRPITSLLTTSDSNWMQPYQGMRIFVRGSKGEGMGYASYTPSPVTIGMKGLLNQGTQVVHMSKGSGSNQDYNLLGNPYASPVDIGTIAYNAKVSGNMAGAAIYVWNPYMATSGIFQAVPVNTVSATPYYIQANAAFEIRAMHNNDSLVFTESSKNATATTSLLRKQPEYLTLSISDINKHPYDMLYVKFDDNAPAIEDVDQDALKLINSDFNFYTLSADNKKLSIDARPYSENGIIPIGVTSKIAQDYIITAENVNIPAGNELYLHDKLNDAYTLLSDGSSYKFSVNGDKSTQGDTRLELVMRKSNTIVSNTFKVDVSPNPTSDIVNLSIATNGKSDIHVNIYDVNGVSIYNKTFAATGKLNTTVSLDNFASGLYTIDIKSGDDKTNKKIIKQ